ncbi:hypothetical protein [Novosphingobium sp. P6W]|uniref:hypothetical protein n=1 Tax=Novosphingobium sp. P6W TaxID=1609758 RepID=UPI0005C30363|nr:hypothetical protein [Novosphingobium sp. P6W]KIS29993.1 hypothetical protein TQ38_25140 [Novosphingobium sp. P6W]
MSVTKLPFAEAQRTAALSQALPSDIEGRFNRWRQHFNLFRKMECRDEAMSSDIFPDIQRSEIWDRWQRGEPMSSIERRFDHEPSSLFLVISPTSGIRPADRKRGSLALSLAEREEISRSLSVSEPWQTLLN